MTLIDTAVVRFKSGTTVALVFGRRRDPTELVFAGVASCAGRAPVSVVRVGWGLWRQA